LNRRNLSLKQRFSSQNWFAKSFISIHSNVETVNKMGFVDNAKKKAEEEAKKAAAEAKKVGEKGAEEAKKAGSKVEDETKKAANKVKKKM
jgi:hypothetical protein